MIKTTLSADVIHSIVDAISAPACHCAENKIQFANDALLRFFEKRLDEVIGVSPVQLFNGNKAGERVMQELEKLCSLKMRTLFGPFRNAGRSYNLKIDYLPEIESTIIQVVDIQDEDADRVFFDFLEKYNGRLIKASITTSNTIVYRGHRRTSPNFYVNASVIRRGITPFGAARWVHAHRITERDEDGRDHEIGTVLLRGEDLVRNIRVSRVELNPNSYSFHVVLEKNGGDAFRPVYRVGRGGKARKLTVGKLIDHWEVLNASTAGQKKS